LVVTAVQTGVQFFCNTLKLLDVASQLNLTGLAGMTAEGTKPIFSPLLGRHNGTVPW
jgi:hypothetical protein